MSNLSVGLRAEDGLMVTVGLDVDGGVAGSPFTVDAGSGVAPSEIDIGALPREPGDCAVGQSTTRPCCNGCWPWALAACSSASFLNTRRLFTSVAVVLTSVAGFASALACVSVACCGLDDLGLLNERGIAGCTRPGADRLRPWCVCDDPLGASFGGMPGGRVCMC